MKGQQARQPQRGATQQLDGHPAVHACVCDHSGLSGHMLDAMGDRCRPKTGWLTGETYCYVHGRAAGWPCRCDPCSPTYDGGK